MILLSTDPDGPVGTLGFPGAFMDLTIFLTPPTGALATVDLLPAFGTRRPPRGRRTDWRRSLRISSSDWSSLPDIFKGYKLDKRASKRIPRYVSILSILLDCLTSTIARSRHSYAKWIEQMPVLIYEVAKRESTYKPCWPWPIWFNTSDKDSVSDR